MEYLILGIIGVIIAPVLGGLISGLDRIITAKFQSRVGPPIMQPFYDVGKLLAKERVETNMWIPMCSWIYLIAAATSVFLFFAQSDLLLIFFVQAVGAVFLVIGAFTVPSPYSQIGANRELLQMMAYEPLLILVFIGISLMTGSFNLSAVWGLEQPLLLKLPLLFIVLGYALTIKLRKSPFDISASHHAHQEIVRGVYTEYSGRYLGLIEIAHWFEVILILGLCAMFWHTNVFGMILLLVVTYMAEILVDNINSRMTWKWMLASAWITGLGLSVINLSWLYAG